MLVLAAKATESSPAVDGQFPAYCMKKGRSLFLVEYQLKKQRKEPSDEDTFTDLGNVIYDWKHLF